MRKKEKNMLYVVLFLAVTASSLISWQESDVCIPKAYGALIGNRLLLLVEAAWLLVGIHVFHTALGDIFALLMPTCDAYMTSRTCGEYDLGNMFLIYASSVWLLISLPAIMLFDNIGWRNIFRQYRLNAWLPRKDLSGGLFASSSILRKKIWLLSALPYNPLAS